MCNVLTHMTTIIIIHIMTTLINRSNNNINSSMPSRTRFKCTRTFWYYRLMFVLTSKHRQSLGKGVTSTKKSTYIRSTYKRECWYNTVYCTMLYTWYNVISRVQYTILYHTMPYHTIPYHTILIRLALVRPFFMLRIVGPRTFESTFRNHCAKKLVGALRKPTSFM